jgi:methionyl-tRNA synthetase
VHRLWRAVDEHGDLYRKTYAGQYCLGCEQYYADDELVDGRCAEHGTPTQRVEEENWFFRLSRYQADLERWLSSGVVDVRPEPFRKEILAFVRAGLDDLSVSRSAARARGWGVPVPDDPDQVVYVWFDALTNYVSALGFGDQPSDDYRRWWCESDERIHVVGKGILRFHAVYWPAFLASAGQPLPTAIQVHPYLTVDGAKLSKSSGHALDAAGVVERFGPDALRWWFARDVSQTADTDVTAARVVRRADNDLADGVGNVVNRIVTLVHRLRDGVEPPARDPLAAAVDLPTRVLAALGRFDTRRAASLVVEVVGQLNRDLDATQPWRVGRDPARACELDDALGRHLATARAIATAIGPITPDLGERLRAQLEARVGRLPSPSPAFARLGSTRACDEEDPAAAVNRAGPARPAPRAAGPAA